MFETKNNESALIPIQTVAKDLGVSKKEVQAMANDGSLVSVNTGKNLYITRESIFRLMRQNEPDFSRGNDNGYPLPEELESPLTKNELLENSVETGDSMEYKGSISHLKDGRFMVQIDLGKDSKGRRNRESKSFREEGDANLYLKKRLDQLNRPPLPSPVVPTSFGSEVAPNGGNYTTLSFQDYITMKLNEGIGSGTSRTLDGYRVTLKPVVAMIGDCPMVELSKDRIKKAFKKMAYTYADSTLKKAFNAVKLLIEDAYEDGDIPLNPMRKLQRPKSQKPVEDIESFPIYSDEEIATLLRTSKQYSQELYTMFTLLECTGMRPGEMRALEWKHFDRNAKTIQILQAATVQYDDITDLNKQPKAKKVISVTKSEYGVRTLKLSDLAVSALCDWEQTLRKSRNPNTRTSPYIFPSRSTGLYKTDNANQSLIQRYRNQYEEELGGIDVTWYKFRHTMCTRLILDKQPIPVVQRLLGDNTPDMVLKVYTHVSHKMAQKSAEEFYTELNKKHIDMAV